MKLKKLQRRLVIDGKPLCDCCGTAVGWTQAIRQAYAPRLLCGRCSMQGHRGCW